jgi:Mitochondrial ribosomal protein mL59
MSANRGVAAAAAAAAAPRFRSALQKLSQHGAEALKPQLIVNDTDRIWKAPLISNRIANVLRKQALNDGTFGTFNTETRIGWDPSWDIEVAKGKPRGQGRYQMKVPKKSKRERTREKRASKIETNMEGMDERMEALWADRQTKKPKKDFETKYKSMMKVQT